MSSDNFKYIWNQQSAPVPDVKLLLEKATGLKKKTRNKLIWMNFLLISTAVFIVLVVIYFHPQMMTTKLGVLLIIIAIVSFVAANNFLNYGLFKSNTQYSTKEYLGQFIRLKQKQEFLQKTMLTIYFILLTSGLMLYMIEYAMRMSTIGSIAAYGITIAWIAFNWFYIRPKTIKKQQAKLNEMIAMLEGVNRNLSSED